MKASWPGIQALLTLSSIARGLKTPRTIAPRGVIRRALERTLASDAVSKLGIRIAGLDQPIGEDQEGSLLDVLPSQQVPADEQLAHTQLQTLFRAKLAEFVKTLNERDEDILRNRILSETPLTLDDLGAKYSITKERTRQLEARIIKRLRDYIKKDIKDFDHLRV